MAFVLVRVGGDGDRDGVGLQRVEFPQPGKILLVGRHETADVRLDCLSQKGAMTVSRKHATLWYDAKRNSPFVEDLASINGVFVNGERIDAKTPHQLKVSDRIAFGGGRKGRPCEFEFEVIEERSESAELQAQIAMLKKERELMKCRNRDMQRVLKQKNKAIIELESLISVKDAPHIGSLMEMSDPKPFIGEAQQQRDQLRVVIEERDVLAREKQEWREISGFKTKLAHLLECPICLTLKREGNLVLKCGHVACRSCLKDWKKKSKDKDKCFTCNDKFFFKEAYRSFVIDACVALLEEHASTNTSSRLSPETSVAMTPMPAIRAANLSDKSSSRARSTVSMSPTQTTTSTTTTTPPVSKSTGLKLVANSSTRSGEKIAERNQASAANKRVKTSLANFDISAIDLCNS